MKSTNPQPNKCRDETSCTQNLCVLRIRGYNSYVRFKAAFKL